jgi:hypothetical protein
MSKDITLTVDYHDRVCVIRWFDHGTGRDQVFTEVPTTKEALKRMVDQARLAAGPAGHGAASRGQTLCRVVVQNVSR